MKNRSKIIIMALCFIIAGLVVYILYDNFSSDKKETKEPVTESTEISVDTEEQEDTDRKKKKKIRKNMPAM